MLRMTLAFSAAAILLTACGCQMCCHPYDHSGPVYSQDGQDGCETCPGARVGSILGGNPQPSASLAGSQAKTSKTRPTAYASQRSRPSSDRPVAYDDDTANNWSPRSRTSGRSASLDTANNWSPRSRTPNRSASFDTADNWSPAGITRGVSGQANGQSKPGYVPGSERIISVTERVVKPAADSSQVADQPSQMSDQPSQLADQSSPELSKPLPSSGWTARRPTPEVLR
jgi:hypothetical protein